MRELLTQYGFDGEAPIIQGSALAALEGRDLEIGEEAIEKLMNAVDKHIPTPVRDLDKPFLMSIEGKIENNKKKNFFFNILIIVISFRRVFNFWTWYSSNGSSRERNYYQRSRN